MARAHVTQLLTDIRSVKGIGALFASLGYRPVHQPGIGVTTVVAKHRAFEVHALLGDNPGSAARRAARQLGAHGLRGVAAAFNDQSLALAAPKAGRASSTKPLVISHITPDPHGVQRLIELAPDPASNALEHWLRVVQVLTTEGVGRRFFHRFRETVDRVATALDTQHDMRDRRLVALIILTRVLFLYFVQAKGWLNGDKRFLPRQLDRALQNGDNFHEACFTPLCFGVLNRPPANRRGPWFASEDLPYLNGGLFEPHPIEQRLAPVRISTALWREVFDGLFERFRFCPSEEEDTAAVAPDMLGQVFERLMDPDDRRQSGSYYTPSDLVAKVIDSALAATFRSQGISSETILGLLAGNRPTGDAIPRLDRALRDLRLLDPAVGSGAFLVAALDRLAGLRSLLQPASSKTETRREVLRDSLFGVDRDPMAVRLAELRLWLSLIADPDITTPAEVTPLPNLDGIVRQGDALMDPIDLSPAHPGEPTVVRATTELHKRRQAVFEARGRNRGLALKRLREAEFQYAGRALDAALVVADREIGSLTATADSPDLFGKRTGLNRVQRSELKRRVDARDTMTRVRERLHEHGELPFFSFGVHAAGIMAGGGFTIVVGNPPWVRAERLPPSYRSSLERRLAWWKASGMRGYAHQPDLAVAFLEQSLNVTRPGGVVAMLLPSKLVSSGYAEPIRRHLARDTTIVSLERVSDRDAARFGATTYPLILVVRKKAPPSDHAVAVGPNGAGTVPQSALDHEGPWVLLPSKERDALAEFRAAGHPLSEFSKPSLGVKTGADDLFVGVAERHQRGRVLVDFGREHDWIESELLRPAVRGRDVRMFRALAPRVVLWPYDELGQVLKRLPPLTHEHATRHAGRLRRRADHVDGPVWKVFRVRGALGKYRLVWSDVARRPRACVLEFADHARTIPLNTCYVAAWRDPHLALTASCVLNSSWAALLAHACADEARGGYRRINARLVGMLPLPLQPDARAPLVELARSAHAGEQVPIHELDEAVADALGISNPARQTLHKLANHTLAQPPGRL